MKLSTLYALLVCTIVLSCSAGNSNKNTITPDVSKLKPMQLEELARNIEVVPLHNASPLGVITRIKQYGNIICAFDQSSQQIVIIDSKKGMIKNVLNQRGRASNEYISIGDFSYNSSRNILTIFDRNSRSLKSYDSELKFIGELKLGYYITAMNYNNDNSLICVREQTNDLPQAVISLDLQTKQTTVLPIDISLFGSELESMTLERVDDKLLYCVNNYLVQVVAINSTNSIDTLQEISFGHYSFPKEIFTIDNYDDFDLSSYLEKPFGVGVVLYTENKGSISFFYMASVSNTVIPKLSLYLKKDNTVYDVENLKYKNSSITPLGVYNGGYMSVIENDDPTSMNSLLIYNF